MSGPPVKQQVLDLAEQLVRKRGFNAFSYRDLANEIGVKTSSIHYYYPGKDDLGEDLVKHYRDGLKEYLVRVDAEEKEPAGRLDRFIDLFDHGNNPNGMICLCGMMATDYQSLGEAIQSQVRHLYADAEAWLTALFRSGADSGAFQLSEPPERMARLVFWMLQGILIAERMDEQRERIAEARHWLHRHLAGDSS